MKGLYFMAGLFIGAVGAYYFTKNKYEKEKEEEIESIRELYKRACEPTERIEKLYKADEPVKAKIPEEKKEDYKEFSNVLNHHGYVNESRDFKSKAEESDHPYVISQDEFGEFSDYEQIELIFYADGALTDDEGELVDDDIEDMIGSEYEEYFNNRDVDAVYVRNDERQVDYEIIRNDDKYYSV